MTHEEQLEFFNERAAIREYDGGQDRQSAERDAAAELEAYRHECEVRSLVRMAKSGGSNAVDRYLFQVEKERGTPAAQRLRNDAKALWVKGKG